MPTFKNIKRYLLLFFQTQLIITAFTIPALTHWGLSISIMSLIGNLIFAPFLMAFIVLSSLLFFTELCNIPNTFLTFPLEWTVSLWNWCLTFGSKQWLITFVHPGNTILLLMLASAICLLAQKRINTPLKKIIAFSLLLAINYTGLKAYQHHVLSIDQTINIKNKMTIIIEDGSISIIDDGLVTSKQSPDKFVEFELKPYLAKQFGTRNIDSLTLKRPGYRSFLSANTLLQTYNIRKIAFPYFDKTLSKMAWREYFRLKRNITEESITLVRQ